MRRIHSHQLPSGNTAGESGMKTVWRVFSYLKRYPALALGMLACAIIATLMVIVFPVVTKQILDVVIRQHHPEQLAPMILLAVLAADFISNRKSIRSSSARSWWSVALS